MGRSLRVRAALSGATAVALGLSVIGTTVAAKPSVPSISVLASGLDNPRGIAVTSDGRIYVAETGAGRVVSIKAGKASTAIGGLPVIVSPEGEASGVHDVLVRGRALIASVGLGDQAQDTRFGSLQVKRGSRTAMLADIQAYRDAHPEPACDPAGNPFIWCDLDQPPFPDDSNAYGMADIGSGRTLVADAGGNELLLVSARGQVTSVARFVNLLAGTGHLPPEIGIPPEVTAIPAEPVPTSVTVGPDGYWYVGQLTGFPFAPGAANVWRIAPSARGVTCDAASPTPACQVYRSGFTGIIDLDFGPDGALYVAEMVKTGLFSFFGAGQTAGALWRIQGGSKVEIAAGQLQLIGGVAVTTRGIFVTTGSVTDAGQVVRIAP